MDGWLDDQEITQKGKEPSRIKSNRIKWIRCVGCIGYVGWIMDVLDTLDGLNVLEGRMCG